MSPGARRAGVSARRAAREAAMTSASGRCVALKTGWRSLYAVRHGTSRLKLDGDERGALLKLSACGERGKIAKSAWATFLRRRLLFMSRPVQPQLCNVGKYRAK